jgi:serine/threonine-protein kinase RIO1
VDIVTKKLGASVAVALLLATSACGGGGRPSEGELSTAFQKGVKGSETSGQQLKLTKKQADCAAKIFEKSKISDEALRAIVDGDKKFKESKKDDAALKKVVPDLMKCAS